MMTQATQSDQIMTPVPKAPLTMKTVAARLILIWFFFGQMLCVCLPAATTKPLSRLEAAYAFKPSSANKAALDNEFERVAQYESQRAIARFALILSADVAVILLFWNLGVKKTLRDRNPDHAPRFADAPSAVS
jgi:hypothetical protein